MPKSKSRIRVTYTKRDGTTATRKAPSGERKRRALTDDNALHLPTKSKQYLMWDTGVKGLHVLVSPGGARTYRSLWYFPHSSKPYSRSLGRVGVMSLQQAQDLCLADQRAAKAGIDPKREAPVRSDMFADVVKEYVEREQIARKENETAGEVRRVLLKECDAWAKRPIASIRVDEIEDVLERVRDGDAEHRARPYLANKLWGYLASMFTWAVKKRKLTVSPMAAIDRPWEGAKPRDRVFVKAGAIIPH